MKESPFIRIKGDFHMNALFSIQLVSKGLGEIAYRKFNKTKWEGMCNIKSEEMSWIRMKPSYLELEYNFKTDGYW